MSIWGIGEVALVMLGAVAAPIVATEMDIARYRKWRWFNPKDGYSSAIILFVLLFALAYVIGPWLIPFPWPGLILPVSVIVWHFYLRRKFGGFVS